jgi:hypothetical protein
LIIVGEVVEKYQKQIFQQLHIPTKQRKRYGALIGIIMSLRQQKHMKNFSNSSFGKKGGSPRLFAASPRNYESMR